MIKINESVKFFLNLAQVQAVLARRFDGALGGLGLSEFMILYHLSQARDEKLRRVDLAEKIGLTASGVTRLLLPMEKIGLVKKQAHADDARVSYVTMASGGKRKLTEALERAELFSEELVARSNTKKIQELSEVLIALGGSLR